MPRIERSGDEYLFLYTGGTTGMPKGVMWRQEDLFWALAEGVYPLVGPAGAGEARRSAARWRARTPTTGRRRCTCRRRR